MLAALVALLGAQGASASEIDMPCIAKGALIDGETIDAAATERSAWNCEGQTNEPAGGDWTLKFEIEPGAEPMRILHTRLGHFDQLDLAVQDSGGQWTFETKTLSDMQADIGAPYIHTALPESGGGQPVLVLASFRGNGHGPTLTRAELRTEPPMLSRSDLLGLLALAALAGVLLIPIALDSAFLFALKESFLAWHIALSLGFASVLAARANLFGLVVDMPADILRITLIMTMGITVSFALMFTRAYIEKGRLPDWLNRAIPYLAVWSFAISAIHAASFEFLRPLGGNFHSFGIAVPTFALAYAMFAAWRNGSRAVRFQLIGWVPLFLASLIQIITHVFPIGIQQDAMPIQYIGVLFEGIGTAMGVADRFIILRRERDRAVRDARALSKLSERDPLTGLLNRRAVETRFENLRTQGFNTFALLDLDRFKQINDEHGHQIGDKALVACAEAIRHDGDRNSIAVRLGGEEFVVLLRGKDARQRAEAFREAIPVRVMHEIEGLNRPVTASMGLIELPGKGSGTMTFDELYARADKLLYEAKATGRNRMIYERLTVFSEAPPTRKAAQNG
ncbi:MAG: diguanylate cyclase [Erythrobacter sp.]